jgi:hypothetical protein
MGSIFVFRWRGYEEGSNVDYFMSLQDFNIMEPPFKVP